MTIITSLQFWPTLKHDLLTWSEESQELLQLGQVVYS